MTTQPKREFPRFAEWFGFFRFFEILLFAVMLESVLIQAAVIVRVNLARDYFWKAGLSLLPYSLWTIGITFPFLVFCEYAVSVRRRKHSDEQWWWSGWWPAFAGAIVAALIGWPLLIGLSTFTISGLSAALVFGTVAVCFAALYIHYVVRDGDDEYRVAVTSFSAFGFLAIEAWGGMIYHLYG